MKPTVLSAAVAFVLAWAFVPEASGLILWNKDNSANQSDPGGGLPWDSVGRVAGSDLSLASSTGSAIYLGNGFMLTANHVTLTSAQVVTFGGNTTFSIDMTYNGGTGSKQVAAGVDLKVFKLTSLPSVTAVNLDPGVAQVASATLVGYGVGRLESAPLASSPVTWGSNGTNNLDTVAKRWGVNVPRQLVTISYSGGGGPYSYTSIRSVAGSSSGSPAGLGDSEASLTLIDSGSAMFQNISGTWYLIGVGATADSQSGSETTTFGNDTVSGGSHGDDNYHVSVATYRTQILAAVPEPGVTGLLVAGAAAVLLCGMHRVRRGA